MLGPSDRLGGSVRLYLVALLLRPDTEVTLVRHDHPVGPLKSAHERLDLIPDRVALGVAQARENRPYFDGIPALPHCCGQGWEPLLAGYRLDDQLAEAGPLEIRQALGGAFMAGS